MDIPIHFAAETPTPIPAVAPTPAPVKTVSVPSAVLAVVATFLIAWNASGVFHVTHTSHSITLDWSGVAPPPTPVPPSPIPPEPTPIPDHADQLRVLFLYDGEVTRTRDQDITLGSTAIRSYLTGHCAKDAGFPAWRFWDRTTNIVNESADWQAAMKAAQADPLTVPKMLVFDGVNLLKSYPVTTESDAIATLRKWGGG